MCWMIDFSLYGVLIVINNEIFKLSINLLVDCLLHVLLLVFAFCIFSPKMLLKESKTASVSIRYGTIKIDTFF